MNYSCYTCNQELEEPIWMGLDSDPEHIYAFCQECLDKEEKTKAISFLVCVTGICLITYFHFQIRPQYFRSDLKRTYYNILQSWQDVSGYFNDHDFYPEVELENLEEIAQRFRKEARNYSSTIGTRNVIPNYILHRVSFKFGTPMYLEAHQTYAVGHCDTKEIVIDPHYWKRFTYWGKEQLLFHELGHCLLEAKHSKEKITVYNRKIASSIMDDGGMISDGDYVLNRNYYLRELFAPITDPLR